MSRRLCIRFYLTFWPSPNCYSNTVLQLKHQLPEHWQKLHYWTILHFLYLRLLRPHLARCFSMQTHLLWHCFYPCSATQKNRSHKSHRLHHIALTFEVTTLISLWIPRPTWHSHSMGLNKLLRPLAWQHSIPNSPLPIMPPYQTLGCKFMQWQGEEKLPAHTGLSNLISSRKI